MEKFCIFCGSKPEAKNKEHIIPKWLIKMTGDSNREISLGRKWNSPLLEERKFSFSFFVFPSCTICNKKYAKMEERAKLIVEKISSRKPIALLEWDLFLDWLDKVRTGIWLAMIYLNKNYRGLVPLFHIEKRISAKDRILIIYEIIDDGKKGISWLATESPIFQHMPSCFAFSINNFLYFNASYDFMFSERFGFPFPQKISFRQKGGFYFEMAPGTSELKLPLIAKKFKAGGTQLFQPMIPWQHIYNEDEPDLGKIKSYNNSYVKENCINFKEGKGKIFKRGRNNLIEYPKAPSSEWIPKQKFSRGEMYHQVGMLTGEFLEELFLKNKNISFSKKQMEIRRNEINSTLKLHRTIMKHFKNQKEMYY